MPRFEYIAINSAKKTEKGTVTAKILRVTQSDSI